MVKYAPRKVYIRESGGYVELSYTEFCRCRESDQTYMDRLKAALPLLSDSEQELIQAIFFDGLSEREVGARLGITQSVVNKRKARILIKLRKIIEN